MAETPHDPEQLQYWIDRLQAGDPAALNELLMHAQGRLRRLARKMLRGFPDVKRREGTDDVLVEAMTRLWKALASNVIPHSVREFYGLASLQIRRVLVDMVRKITGPRGVGANEVSFEEADRTGPAPCDLAEQSDTTNDPGTLEAWERFHAAVDSLPPEEREAFDLHYYQGLSQVEAAKLLGISLTTFKRIWFSARRHLIENLKDQLPGQ